MKSSRLKINSIKVNAFLNMLYNLVNMIFPVITYPYVSRVLSVTGIGRVNFFTSIANYAILLAGLGIPTYGIKAIAKVRENKEKLKSTFYDLLRLNFLSTLIIVIIYFVICLNVKRLYTNIPLAMINGLWIISAPLSIDWLYSGLEQYGYITKRTVLFKVLSLILIFVFVRRKADYIIYAFIIVFANVGSYFCNLFFALKLFSNVKIKGEKHNLLKHIKPTLILFASSLAISVYTNLDMVMLGFIRGNQQVGLYTTSIKVESVLLTAVNAISTALLPRLSFYISQNRIKEFNQILKNSISIISLITFSVSSFFIIASYDCIYILGGKEFTSATFSMQLLMPILVISGFSNITGNQILIPKGDEIYFLYGVTAGALMDFILNLFLMKPLGCVGASISTLIAEMVQATIQIYFARKTLKNNIQFFEILKALSAAILASLMVICLTIDLTTAVFFNFIIKGIIYFATYVILLYIFREKFLTDFINNFIRRI